MKAMGGRRFRCFCTSVMLMLVSVVCLCWSTVSASASAPLLVAASSQHPWRPNTRAPKRYYRSSQQRQQRQQYSPQPSESWSSHSLDYRELNNDKRNRLWKVSNSRRPGKLSITSRLLILNVLVYAAQVWNPQVTVWGIKQSAKILNGQELYRLITPMFLHGNLIHLFSNMNSLRASGPDVERLFGPGRYLASYFVAGVAGTLLSAYQSPNPSLGASGAVFGVYGAYFVFLQRNEWLLGNSGGDAMSTNIAGLLGTNILLGMVSPRIDNWGHLGGFVGGAAMAYLFGPRLFVSEVPTLSESSSTSRIIIIDQPLYRLPRAIEALPERVGHTFTRISRRMHVERFKSDLPDLPWRRNQQQPQVGPSYYQRQSAPNRSIKPKAF